MRSSKRVRAGIASLLTVSLAVLVFAGCGGDTVPPDPISKLAITVEPTDVVAGASISPAIEVTVQRASGATATGATDTITIAIDTNAGGGTLSGTLSVDAVAGIAVFNDLSIDLAGIGYTLIVSSGTLTGDTSQAFNVTPDVAVTLDVTGIADPITAGTPSDVTVTARDVYGNVATGYTGIVTFIENDPHVAASVPVNYAFVGGDAGVRTFTSGVTLATAGSRTVTATDIVTGSITGFQTVTADPAVVDHLAYGSAPQANETAGATWTTFTVRIEDAYDNLRDTDTDVITVALATGAGPLNGTLTPSAAAGVATFSTLSYDTAESITFDVTGAGATDITGTAMTIDPDVAATLDVTGISDPMTAGDTSGMTVTARDAYGNVATGYTGTVAFTEDDVHASAAVPGDYTFVGGDAGIRAFPGGVTLATVGSRTVTATDNVTGTITGNQAVTVNPGAAVSLGVTDIADPITAGSSSDVTVTARDAYGNIATSYTGTVAFTENDPHGLVVVPGNYVFVGGDAGVNTFTLGVTLITTGSRTVMATDTATGSINGSQAVTVAAATPDHLVYGTAPQASETAGATWTTFTVRIEDVYDNLCGVATDVITVALTGVPSDTLNGTVAPNAAVGIATFSTLSYDTAEGVAFEVTGAGATKISSIGMTIDPDVAVTLEVTGIPDPVTAGNPSSLTVTARDVYGNVATGYTGIVTFTKDDAHVSASVPSDYTFLVVDAGVRVFPGDVTLVTAGSRTVTATDTVDGTITGVQTVTVNPDVALNLGFSVEPTDATAGAAIAPSIKVEVQDNFGNLVVTASDSVTIAFDNNAGGGTLSGTLVVAATGGVASFPGLWVDKASAGYTLSASSGGLTVDVSAAFQISPAAAHHLAFGTAPQSSETAGATWTTFTVRIEDIYDNLLDSATDVITVALGSGAGPIDGTLTPSAVGGIATFADLSYDTAEVMTFDVTGASAAGITSTGVTIDPDVAVTLDVTGIADPITAGSPSGVTVTARDAYGNVAIGYTGTVAFTKNDAHGSSSVPVDYTFVGGDAGVRAFPGGVTLATAGSRTVTATDDVTGTITGFQTVTVNPAAAATLDVTGITDPLAAGGSSDVTVTARDTYGNVATGYLGTVTFSEDDVHAVASVPGNYAFVGGDAGVRVFTGGVTLATAGSRTVTATDTVTGSITGNQTLTVDPDAPAALSFSVQPVDTVAAAAIAPAIEVQVIDVYDNFVNTATDSITLALGRNPAGAVLSGTLTQSASAGTATFAGISLNAAGPGVTLLASAASRTGDTSVMFEILPVGLPTAPTGLATIAGNTAVSLTWNAVGGATGYALYRATTTGGPYVPIAQTPSIGYTNTALANGTNYYYVVSALTASGEGAQSSEASATTTATPPVAPTGLSAAAGKGEVTLVWTDVVAATSYNIYSATTSGGAYSLLGSSTGPSYTDTTPTNGTTYYYVVRSSGPPEGTNSAEVSATPQATGLPAPANVVALAGNTEALLTWDPVALATEYNVFRAGATGGPYSLIGSSNAPYYTDTLLNNVGTVYYYVVQARYPQSAYSLEVNVDPAATVPLAPTGVEAIAGNTEVTVRWTAPGGAVSYNLYRRTDGATWASVATPSDSPYTDTGRTNGTTYYYAVAATGGGPEGAWSDEVFATPQTGSPVSPTDLAASPGSTWVRLTWTASAGATAYDVYRSTTLGGPYSFITQTVSAGCDITGLTNGTAYYFVVAPVTGMSEGAYSNEASATPLATTSPQEPVLTARPGQDYVLLEWSNAAGATGYNVFRGTSSGTYPTDLGVQGSPFVDNSAVIGTLYYYVVMAMNAGPAVTSNEASATPVAGTPPTPTGITVVPGNTQTTVYWNPVDEAGSYVLSWGTSSGGPYSTGSTTVSMPGVTLTGFNNIQNYYFVLRSQGWPFPAGAGAPSSEVSSDPDGALPLAPVGLNATAGNTEVGVLWTVDAGATDYKVYRRTDGAPWALVSGPSTTSPFADTSLTNGTRYYYMVSAVNGFGEGAWASEVNATPLDANLLAPTNGAAIPGNLAITVTWDVVPGAGSYVVRWGTSSGGPYSTGSTTVTAPGFTAGTLFNNTDYYFIVQALGWPGPAGQSAFAPELTAKPLLALPLAPTSLNATVGNTEATLIWDVDADATDYKVYRRTDGAPWALVSAPSTTSPFTDTGLTNGVRYYYMVSAVNVTGEGAWANEINKTPLAFNLLAPTIGTATPGNGAVMLAWDIVTGAGSYVVRWGTSSGGPYSTGSTTVTAPGFTAGTLFNNTDYYFIVQALGWPGPAGQSAFAPELTAKPLLALPLAPTSLSATVGNTEATLIWDVDAGATNYKVYRRTDGAPWALISGPSTTSPFTDTGLTNGTRYYYIVSMVNATGEGAGANEVNTTPLDANLLAPTNGAAIPGNLAATLTWDVVPGAGSYVVRWGTSSGGPYSTGSLTASHPGVTVGSLLNDTDYYFLVQAQGWPGPAGLSAFAPELTAMPVNTVLLPPGGLGVATADREVALTWGAVGGATGYEVYWRTATSEWMLIGTPGTNSFTDTGLTNGEINYYAVATVNGGGSGAWSTEVSATPNP